MVYLLFVVVRRTRLIIVIEQCLIAGIDDFNMALALLEDNLSAFHVY
jgi:hypothetical protein